MDQPEIDTGETIKINFSGLPEALAGRDKALIKQIVEELRTDEKPSPHGKGVVEAYADQKAKVLESIRNIGALKAKAMTEEWTIALPLYHQAEIRAGLRDHVWLFQGNQGNAGDIARIPYVRDFDFELLAAVGAAFAGETTGLLDSLTTTLYEAGAWSDIEYYLLERFDANTLDMLNQAFTRAAVRAEDAAIMTLVNALTNTMYANVGEGGAALTGTVGRSTGPAAFYAANVPQALGKLMAMGKQVHPSECVLYITPRPYAALLEELASSQVIAYATPQVIQQGEVEKYLGVKILVGGYKTHNQRTNTNSGTVEIAYLMRGRRAVALAPKRDILIQTDPQIATREMRIAGSHTFGIKLIEEKEIVMIWTSAVY